MRRVASSWVFRSEDQILHNAFVVLTDEYVGYYSPMEDDMPPTEWMGGAIFLSPIEELDLPELVTIQDLKKLLLDSEYTPRYAYYLDLEDIHSNQVFPSEKLVRLIEDPFDD